MQKHLLTYSLAILFLFVSSLRGQEWTRFRGPNGSGESEATTIPTSWTDSDYNWKIELPGAGHSSPVLWGDKIFLTGAADEGRARMLFCIDATDGHLLWNHTFPSDAYHVHKQNSFASSSAVVDGERVYTFVVTPEHYRIYSLNHSGEEVWNVDLGPFVHEHGFGTSPILYEGMLIAGNEQDGDSFLIALNAENGKEIWRSPRRTERAAYSTPCVYEPTGGKPELIFQCQAHGMCGIDPSNGKTNWEIDVFDQRTVSSPIVVGDLIIGSCGSGGGGNYAVAVKPGAKPEEIFRFKKQAAYVPTSVAHGNLLFMFNDAGIVSCLEVPSNKLHWQKRIGGNFSSSPVRAGQAIYCVSVEGDVVVVAAKKEYEPIARIPLGEVCRSTPAIANGRMYLRTESHLYSLGGK
jgi:outer membrane protein assembly factor BamB